MTRSKYKVLFGVVVIGVILLSGCIGDNSEPPSGYRDPSKSYDIRRVDVELKYEPSIFYFGDVVQDNGSVGVSKTVNWTLTIVNNGTEQEDVRFEILQFPRELLIWSTELKMFEIHTVEAWAEEENETFNITYTYEHILEYDYYGAEFERIKIDGLKTNSSTDVVFSITFNETVAWSYSPDTTYVGHFEIRKRTIDPKCNNIRYDEVVIPFVVRT